MKRHVVYCDRCRKNAELEYNGEHYLIPEDWILVVDRDYNKELHVCNWCVDEIFKKSKRALDVLRPK